jgi:hypothetical protein
MHDGVGNGTGRVFALGHAAQVQHAHLLAHALRDVLQVGGLQVAQVVGPEDAAVFDDTAVGGGVAAEVAESWGRR